MKHSKRVLAAVLCLLYGFSVDAAGRPGYDPRKAFDPLFDAGSKGGCRASNGLPGPAYWQNRADYDIDATLNDSAHVVSATVRLTYTNNSPDDLTYLWLALDQNRFADASRSSLVGGSLPSFVGGFTILRVEIGSHGRWRRAEFLTNDTRMQVRLPIPLKAGGGRVVLRITYAFPVPPAGLGRSGMVRTENGVVYDIAQWYPRMDVYDDISGWNVLPYLGAGEFYLEYGDFDYRVTVPADQIVIGSGRLVNAREVLSADILRRLAQAGRSDATVAIRTLTDIERAKGEGHREKTRTWHFRMEDARDVVWASSPAFLWDAARIILPNRKTALAMAAYPVESAKDTTWKRAVQYIKRSVEIFSRDWYPYPYAEAVAVGGPVGGMEYPAVIFGSWKASRKGMWIVANHEIGHEWFPMIVGSNERVHAWMDEGFNTFIDIYATEEFNHGEFAPKRDNEYAPRGGDPAREIVPYLVSPQALPIVSYADAIPGSDVHRLEYYKAALGLVLLREDILGKERFDYAFRTYIRAWAFKHPTPFDFFRAMNNAAGENLNWFWKGWYVEDWTLDQAVRSVRYVEDDTVKGALITIANNDQMVMPVIVRVREASGAVGTVRLPVEVWERSGEHTFAYPSTHRIMSVKLDPDRRLPDIDTSNNVWPREP
jgi:hypothetical protein